MVIYKSLSIRTINEKKGKWHNLLRTDVQPTEHCKSMVVSGSHWNLLICYDIVLYTVWNTDSFPLYGFWSLNLFCACVSFCFYFFFLFSFFCTNPASLRWRWIRWGEKERGSTAGVSVIYIHFISWNILRINIWQEMSPANLDALDVQGHQQEL